MNDFVYILPKSDMNFWKINNENTSVRIKWTRNCFEDYKILAYRFFNCGNIVFEEVFNDSFNNAKSDMWFLTGVFLVRHSFELGLKALLCRALPRKRDIEDAFEECCHDLLKLFTKYSNVVVDKLLTNEEETWLNQYLNSLEEVDKKSDTFRFPFEDDFRCKYRDKILDNVKVANNLLQGFALIEKCIEKRIVDNEDNFDNNLEPEFFVFTSCGFGNCYLSLKGINDDFFNKITGYTEVIDYIYQNQQITNEDKLYPLIFMFRNTIELYLKKMFYTRVDNGVPARLFMAKRKSHNIKKDLWKNVKPTIVKYAKECGEDLRVIDIAEKMLDEVNTIDKNGDRFRYPTSYSLEYYFNEEKIDIANAYAYLRAIVNFLDGCGAMLDRILDYETDRKAEYNN